MSKISFYISVFFILISSKVFAQSDLVINLRQEVNTEIYFPDDLIEFDLKGIDKFKKYKNFIANNYKGIPVLDSLKFHVFYIEDTKFLYDLYKSGKFEKADFNNFIERFSIDTLGICSKKINQSLVCIVGFKGNLQIIIADTNNNFDFNDEQKYEFDYIKSPVNSLKKINKQYISNLGYEYENNKIVYKVSRKFILYPNSNHYYSQRMNNSEKKYLSFIKFLDHWKGSKKHKKDTFNFYVQAITNKNFLVYINNEKIKLSKSDPIFNRQFLYNIGDTVNLSNDFFKIDSISNSVSKLYLSKVNSKNDLYGYSVGHKLKNFEIEYLNGEIFSVFAQRKKYTLIEFWGTWCGPCVEMTPKLIEFYSKYSTNTNIVSIAVDKNKDVIKNYISKHNIKWDIGYIPYQKNWENPIIKQLKIQSFPTFILLDSDGKILHRGSPASFDKIQSLINEGQE